ncbi:MAG: DUF47 domain-containing protein [Deltaproteobacteria bacterium]|nr:DUF47 domain-containing protein [Deltaproteobacteria bacterium]
MFRALLPRETSFFDFFEHHAQVTVEGARELLALATETGPIEPRARRIKEIEHENDVITHQCVDALHRTFITPIDRHDIHRLISRMDDVIDLVDGAADRMRLYELTPIRPEVKEFAEILVQATQLVEKAVHGLRNMKGEAAIKAACIEINRLENDGDALFRRAVLALFRETNDAIFVIKWKEVFVDLEAATDRCEDVANLVEGILLEHA